MNIDTSIVDEYLETGMLERSSKHWIFRTIEKERLLFEAPPPEQTAAVSEAYERTMVALGDFMPYNHDIFSLLFPNYVDVLTSSDILICVGCPEPYDAMVRTYCGKEYIVFDMLRLAAHAGGALGVESVIGQLVTHELAHACLHKRYPVYDGGDYYKKLDYICFDEGVAHLLAFPVEVASFDFTTPEYRRRYLTCRQMLSVAAHTVEPDRRSELLEQAATGAYWDKFGAISGMMYMAQHIDELCAIYSEGYDGFAAKVLQHQP